MMCLLGSVAREGLQSMAGLYSDWAKQGSAIAQAQRLAGTEVLEPAA